MSTLYYFHHLHHRWCWPLSRHNTLPTNMPCFPGRQNASVSTETQHVRLDAPLMACYWGGLINWKRSSNDVESFPRYLQSRPRCAGPDEGRDIKTAPAGPHPSPAAHAGKWDGDQGLCPPSLPLLYVSVIFSAYSSGHRPSFHSWRLRQGSPGLATWLLDYASAVTRIASHSSPMNRC